MVVAIAEQNSTVMLYNPLCWEGRLIVVRLDTSPMDSTFER